ncbi:MAG: diacylglycerol kinase family lipid kinase [Clostridiales bacterium]|jgi:YegS/Rv2252/BmrU family lipid kinase|nr:diacylglycerol kinase family lipid kinase [Clostridiales bacterium]
MPTKEFTKGFTKDFFHIIYNPHANRGGCKVYLEAFTGLLDAENSAYAIYTTKEPGHATEITKEIIAAGGRFIVILGGDGTVHEVLNGYSPEDDAVFGILPAGTGNDVATMLGLPPGAENMQKAAKAIIARNIKSVDYIAEAGGKQSILFFSYGIAAQMVMTMDNFAARSKASYYHSLIMRMFRYKAATYRFSIDGGPMQSVKADFLGMHNCIHGGGGMQLAREAVIDDGFADVFIVENRGLGRRILNLISLFTKRVHKQPNVRIIRAKTLDIYSDDDDLCCVDGEILRTKQLNLTIKHRNVKIFKD